MEPGKVLWKPDDGTKHRSNIAAYMRFLGEIGKKFEDYEQLRRWSVDDLEGFWQSIWDYFDVKGSGSYAQVLSTRKMPGARWFDGAELNYAEHVLRNRREGAALIIRRESGGKGMVSWQELEKSVAGASEGLRGLGVGRGDRVAAYLPNSSEAAVALLACASIGAIWSSCPPENGAPSVLDRFRQIEPKVLLAASSYDYGGKTIDRSEAVAAISAGLPSLSKVVRVQGDDSVGMQDGKSMSWGDLVSSRGRISFEKVPFSHPLWILYSSGTTGLPKPIVHGHGGVLLEHLKALSLHNDVKQDDRFFWFTTTGWMMWNYVMGAMLAGASVVLYDGSPGYPNMGALWDVAEETGITFFGTGAAFITSCMKAGIRPGSALSLKSLRGVGTTGSPLSPEGFEWIYSHVKGDLWVAPISGGTDIASGFVGGCPLLPVNSGEMQCRLLGAAVEAYDEAGKPVIGTMGELVATAPMPSMPLYFWGDGDGSRYHDSYFSTFPGIWRHGDWILMTDRGTCIIYGRSDATIKRLGVRIGTSELYRVVEALPEVSDSLAVDLENLLGSAYLLLFVAPSPGHKVDSDLKKKIREKIRDDISPRYVPDEVLGVDGIPKTLNGKKLEVPIRRIFLGADPTKVVNRDTLSNPETLDQFLKLSKTLRSDWKV